MATSSATLIVYGEDVDPELTSDLLQLQPNLAWRKGDTERTRVDGSIVPRSKPAAWGGWKRWLDDDLMAQSLNEQLVHWASLLAGKAEAINRLKQQSLSIELNCCVVAKTVVVHIPDELQQEFGGLGIDLDITFYRARPKKYKRRRAVEQRTAPDAT